MGGRETVVGARLAGATTLTPLERGQTTRLRAKPTRNADIAFYFIRNLSLLPGLGKRNPCQ